MRTKKQRRLWLFTQSDFAGFRTRFFGCHRFASFAEEIAREHLLKGESVEDVQQIAVQS